MFPIEYFIGLILIGICAGFASGLLGVVVTYLLCIPINAILHMVTGLNNLSAVLPIEVALILVGISMLLTVFAGIIPSRSAARPTGSSIIAIRAFWRCRSLRRCR